MNVTIIGGSGLIGRNLAPLLERAGHRVTLASPSQGVNTLTGEGLAQAVAGADVVVDVSNSPSFEEQAVMQFFRTSTTNLLAAEEAAGVRHHVALSVVGANRLADSGYYMRAKVAQEALIKGGKVPYTIVRATQFFEFLTAIAGDGAGGRAPRISSALFQPMAAGDVAQFLASVVPQDPRNGVVEVGGPERLPMNQAVQRALDARGDARRVVTDAQALYFGSLLNDQSLVTGAGAQVSATTLDAWLAKVATAGAR
jgi:uncharacterized protein YbjT (DUF2867 family)